MFFRTANNKSLEVREERVQKEMKCEKRTSIYVGGKKVQKGQENKIVKVLNLSKVSHKLENGNNK